MFVERILGSQFLIVDLGSLYSLCDVFFENPKM
ncbi:hypothetical protein MXMO3_01512 [Maritalea myrionectae]|uniref:Uncharacterized protein n=1 Tax=Maritalea myrionectae TaxID=454601 RepID=A0A2R4MDF3_9HYPH|nr:hypothetical protein MXMO3_01512 [Maritalea myrionectae]